MERCDCGARMIKLGTLKSYIIWVCERCEKLALIDKGTGWIKTYKKE